MEPYSFFPKQEIIQEAAKGTSFSFKKWQFKATSNNRDQLRLACPLLICCRVFRKFLFTVTVAQKNFKKVQILYCMN